VPRYWLESNLSIFPRGERACARIAGKRAASRHGEAAWIGGSILGELLRGADNRLVDVVEVFRRFPHLSATAYPFRHAHTKGAVPWSRLQRSVWIWPSRFSRFMPPLQKAIRFSTSRFGEPKCRGFSRRCGLVWLGWKLVVAQVTTRSRSEGSTKTCA
jgi:hypothetical protein